MGRLNLRGRAGGGRVVLSMFKKKGFKGGGASKDVRQLHDANVD